MDPWSPFYTTQLTNRLTSALSPYSNDSWAIGMFVDYQIVWGCNSANPMTDYAAVVSALALDNTTYIKPQFTNYLYNEYNGSISAT